MTPPSATRSLSCNGRRLRAALALAWLFVGGCAATPGPDHSSAAHVAPDAWTSEDPSSRARLERYAVAAFGYLSLFNGLKASTGDLSARITSEAPVVFIDAISVDHALLLLDGGVPASPGRRARPEQVSESCSRMPASIAGSARLRLLGLCALGIPGEKGGQALRGALGAIGEGSSSDTGRRAAPTTADLIFLLRVARQTGDTGAADLLAGRVARCLADGSVAPSVDTVCQGADRTSVATSTQLLLAALETPALARPGHVLADAIARAARSLSASAGGLGEQAAGAPIWRLCRELNDPSRACLDRYPFTPNLDGVLVRHLAAVLRGGGGACLPLRRAVRDNALLLEHRPALSRAIDTFINSNC